MERTAIRIRALLSSLRGEPEPREIILRSNGRVTYIPLSRLGLLTLVVILGAAGAWIGHASISYFGLHRVIAGKDREIARSDERNRILVAKMTEMREEFSDVAGTLEHNHRDLMNLLSQNHQLKRDMGDVEQKLQDSETKRVGVVRERQQIGQQLSEVRRRMSEVEKNNTTLQANLDRTKSRLADSIVARNSIDAARNSLDEQVKGLDAKLARLRSSQTELLNRVTRSAVADIRRAERVIARAGLNFEKLVRGAGGELGQGGPFIPVAVGAAANADDPSSGDPFEDGVAIYDRHIERLKQIRFIMHRLPLAAPLADFRVSSSFGRRRDPFNKKWARHEGVDLAGTSRSPVIAPAPGKVLFAGWKGRFGRFVTIDHGMGIRTRYGHLRRILVKKGQTVKARQMIGQLGSSGRSTGTHLHYEILINRRPVNPMKFLKAGKDVFKG